MRYVLAIAALVLAGVLLVLGIGQRTFLAGPTEIRYEAVDVSSADNAAYAVIDETAFDQVPGQANVVVSGADAFVAAGATRDVLGWLDGIEHVTLSPVKKSQSLELAPSVAVSPDDVGADAQGQTKDSDADSADAKANLTDVEAAEDDPAAKTPDPQGSDLWLTERFVDADSDKDTVRMPVKLAEGQSVLVASAGGKALPSDIAIVWVQDRATPWAGPLLAAGGLLALVGAILYLIAIDHDRRGLGPRRGRKGPLLGIRNSFSRSGKTAAAQTPAMPEQPPASDAPRAPRTNSARKFALPAVGVAVVVGLSGCSAAYWPQFGDDSVEETEVVVPQNIAPVPVTDTQLDLILERVVAVANEADDTLDPDLLETRFSGDAFAQRAANYKIRAAQPDYGVVPPRITTDELDYQLVQSTESWPRTLMVTVASEKGGAASSEGDVSSEAADPVEGEDAEPSADASPSLAMVMTQESAHDNYVVSHVISLRGGLTMPAAAPAEEGTALLADDLESLILQPGQVGTAFASVLQDGEASESFELFDLGTDKLLENYGKARAAQSASQAESNGTPMTYSVSARESDEPVVALSTGVGGALVVTTVIEEQVADSAGGRFKPEASGVVTALSGLSGQQDRIAQQIAHQLLFFVPSKSDEGAKIQLLGETSELVGVGN